MTALGVALTVAVLVGVLALVEGLRTSFVSTGHPLNVLVMRKGSTAELTSNFNRTSYQDLRSLAGIARNASGELMASLEMVTVILLDQEAAAGTINITLRGITPAGIEMREGLRLVEGRMFQPGQREVVVGKSIGERYPEARLGRKLKFGRGDWTVVGVMDGGRSAYNSEIFADLNQVSGDYNRTEVLSSALVRATDEAAMQALINRLEGDPRFNVMAQSEKSYYAQQTSSALPIQILGYFVASVMAIGSSFAAMNTMYAAVARRAAEIGTLRVLGFSRGGILASFFIESLLLSAIGGVLGCLLVLPLNNISTGIGSFVTFAEIVFNFQITPSLMAAGVGFALVMGAIGGFFPARMAAKKEILAALREG
jgi:putative ABC transport system permease protein